MEVRWLLGLSLAISPAAQACIGLELGAPDWKLALVLELLVIPLCVAFSYAATPERASVKRSLLLRAYGRAASVALLVYLAMLWLGLAAVDILMLFGPLLLPSVIIPLCLLTLSSERRRAINPHLLTRRLQQQGEINASVQALISSLRQCQHLTPLTTARGAGELLT